MRKVMNKQFEMLGVKVRFEDIPDDGLVEVGKKKKEWYNVYKFTEDQEDKWREWAEKEIAKVIEDKETARKLLMKYELVFGLNRIFKKSGELF